MRYNITLSPEALEDLQRLLARDRSLVRDAIEEHLRYEPKKQSKSRIKRLRGISRPQYRLRVDAFRVFYDVVEEDIEILAIVSKQDAVDWLESLGGMQ